MEEYILKYMNHAIDYDVEQVDVPEYDVTAIGKENVEVSLPQFFSSSYSTDGSIKLIGEAYLEDTVRIQVTNPIVSGNSSLFITDNIDFGGDAYNFGNGWARFGKNCYIIMWYRESEDSTIVYGKGNVFRVHSGEGFSDDSSNFFLLSAQQKMNYIRLNGEIPSKIEKPDFYQASSPFGIAVLYDDTAPEMILFDFPIRHNVPQILKQNQLLSLENYTQVNRCYLKYSGDVKVLVTTDMQAYYTWDRGFVRADIEDIADVGIQASLLPSLPRLNWNLFTEAADGIAFVYALMGNEARLYKMTLLCDEKDRTSTFNSAYDVTITEYERGEKISSREDRVLISIE